MPVHRTALFPEDLDAALVELARDDTPQANMQLIYAGVPLMGEPSYNHSFEAASVSSSYMPDARFALFAAAAASAQNRMNRRPSRRIHTRQLLPLGDPDVDVPAHTSLADAVTVSPPIQQPMHSMQSSVGGYKCPCCYERREDLSVLKCGHVFCTE